MKIGAILLCAVVLVSAVSCSSSGSKAPNGMTADEIVSNCENTSSSINTAQMHAVLIVRNQSGCLGSINWSYIVDTSNRSAYKSYTSTITATSSECYVVNDWIYACNSTSTWIKTPLTEDYWNSLYRSALQPLDILQNYEKASYHDMQPVSGTNCYEINITADAEEEAYALGLYFLNITGMQSHSCAVWITENTYYPAQMAFDFTWPDESRIGMVVNYSSINEPVNITLPAEAQNATAISYSAFESGDW